MSTNVDPLAENAPDFPADASVPKTKKKRGAARAKAQATPSSAVDEDGEVLILGEGIESQIVTRWGRPERVVTLRGAAATKDFLLFCEFPFATLSDGRGKKDALQTASRIEREWNVVDPRTGKTVRVRWQVDGDKDFGLPTAQDELMYLILMQLSREQGFPEKVLFTRHDLVKRLGWSHNNERYEDIELGLRRLAGVRIFAKNVVRPIPGKPGASDLCTTGFSLIGSFLLKNETPGGKKTRKPDENAPTKRAH